MRKNCSFVSSDFYSHKLLLLKRIEIEKTAMKIQLKNSGAFQADNNFKSQWNWMKGRGLLWELKQRAGGRILYTFKSLMKGRKAGKSKVQMQRKWGHKSMKEDRREKWTLPKELTHLQGNTQLYTHVHIYIKHTCIRCLALCNG